MADGSIGILDTNSESILMKYYPDGNELTQYGGTFSFSPGEDLTSEIFGYDSYLYIDKYNHLWVDDRGWLENTSSENPAWHRVIRSPLFINLYFDGVGNYYWDRPKTMYQSTNEVFWFSADVGVIKLDPKNGDWCLLTTYSSPVVEDDSQNLWIVADGQLYKNHIEQ